MLLYHYKGFSGGAARTLRAAVRLAGRQGCAETDTGHLLLAMLRTARGPAADFLRRKRVTETALRACVPARGEGARLPFWQKSPKSFLRRERISSLFMHFLIPRDRYWKPMPL